MSRTSEGHESNMETTLQRPPRFTQSALIAASHLPKEHLERLVPGPHQHSNPATVATKPPQTFPQATEDRHDKIRTATELSSKHVDKDVIFSSDSFRRLLSSSSVQDRDVEDAIAARNPPSGWWKDALHSAFGDADTVTTEKSTTTAPLASTLLLSFEAEARRRKAKTKIKAVSDGNKGKLRFRLNHQQSTDSAAAVTVADAQQPVGITAPHIAHEAPKSSVFDNDEDEDDFTSAAPQKKPTVATALVHQYKSSISGDALDRFGFSSSYNSHGRPPAPLQTAAGIIAAVPVGDVRSMQSQLANGMSFTRWGEPISDRTRDESSHASGKRMLMALPNAITVPTDASDEVPGWMKHVLTATNILAPDTRKASGGSSALHGISAMPLQQSLGRGFTDEDFILQALHAAPLVKAREVVADTFVREAKVGGFGQRAAAGAEITSEQALYAHPPPTVEQIMNGLSKRDYHTLAPLLPGYLARLAHEMTASILKTRVPCRFKTARKLLDAAPAAPKGAQQPQHQQPGSTAFSAAQVSGVRTFAAAQITKVDDLSCKQGPVLLLEYMEQVPTLLPAWGMCSAIVTYEKAVTAALDDDAAYAGGALLDDEAVLTRLETGQRRVLGIAEQFPMLGSLDKGQKVTALSNKLFEAPMFRHAVPPTDFLLVLKFEKDKQAKAPAIAVHTHGKTAVGYLREIGRVFAVGQVEPKVVVFGPAARQQKKAALAYGTEATKYLQDFLCYQLLLMFAAVDEERHHRERNPGGKPRALPLGAIEEAGGGLAVGMLRVSDVMRRFQTYCALRRREMYIKFVAEVADVNSEEPTDHHKDYFIRKIDAPSPEDFRDAKGLSLENIAAFESLRAGEEILHKAGLKQLRIVDRGTEDAMRQLRKMYNSMVDNLRKALADAAATAAASGGEAVQWDRDAGYLRVRKTLEVTEAVYYLLQTMPWATSQNYQDYVKAHDLAALAIQDPNGAGDPSGRDEAFSFIREFSLKKLETNTKAPLERREGTEKDVRRLTNAQLMELLQELGAPPDKLAKLRHASRWTKLDAVKQYQLEYNTVLDNQSHALTSFDASFIRLGKLNAKDRPTIKQNQATDIQRRQYAALSAKKPPSFTEAEENELDNIDLDELGRDVEREIRQVQRKQFNMLSEKLEYEKHMQAKASAGVETVTSSSRKSFPVPDNLLRCPPGPLIASAHTTGKGKAADKDAPPGYKNPVPVSSFAEPPPPATFMLDEGKDTYLASGKILRIVSTSVDDAGRQVVRVTYSRNPFAIKQAWLKQRHHVDMGLFGLRFNPAQVKNATTRPPASDPDLMGIIGTGVFPHPKVANYMKSDATKQFDHCKHILRDLWPLGFILDGRNDGGKHGDHVPASATRVVIHGTPIPICKDCRMWGHSHNSDFCPRPSEALLTSFAVGSKRERGEVIDVTGSEPKKLRAAEPDARPLDVSRLGKSTVADKAYAHPAAAIRRFCSILEEVLVTLLNLETYNMFAVPVNPALVPGYDHKIKHPMDLGTLRRNVVARKYASLEAFNADLSLIASNSRIFNGELSRITKDAMKLQRDVTKKVKQHMKELLTLEDSIVGQHRELTSRYGNDV